MRMENNKVVSQKTKGVSIVGQHVKQLLASHTGALVQIQAILLPIQFFAIMC